MLIVDAANVVGSRPTGWWRDRAGAARGLVDRITQALAAGALPAPIVVVLEGRARDGVPAGVAGPEVEIVHAPRAGDDVIVELATRGGSGAVVVTADRALAARAARHDARVVGPTWLLDRIGPPPSDRTVH